MITDGEVNFDEDGDADDAWKGFSSENWAVRNGSVGEWLQVRMVKMRSQRCEQDIL